MTDENGFSHKYVVENRIKIFVASSLSSGHSLLMEIQKGGLGKDGWSLAVRAWLEDRSVGPSFSLVLTLPSSVFAANGSVISVLPGLGSSLFG